MENIIKNLIYKNKFEEAARMTAFFKYDKEAIASEVIRKGGMGYAFLDACSKIGYW